MREGHAELKHGFVGVSEGNLNLLLWFPGYSAVSATCVRDISAISRQRYIFPVLWEADLVHMPLALGVRDHEEPFIRYLGLIDYAEADAMRPKHPFVAE